MSERIEKEIQKVIVGLANSLKQENDIKNKETVKEIIKIMDETNYNFSDPDTFNCMFAFPLEQLLESIVINLHKEISIEVKDKHKPEFIFIHYSYLKSNIEKLIEKKMNDMSCVADRSRHILKMYLEYSLTGIIPKDCFEEHFWLPKFGNNKQWIDFCDGLYLLYYGKNEQYLESYNELIHADIRQYAHVKYSLVATLKNNEKVIMDECYDRGFAKLPIAENGFFNIPKRAFEEKQEYENSDSLGELLNRFYYKVPEKDVLKIEIKDEIVIV